MDRNIPVIIENRQLPIDSYRKNKKNSGFSDIVFILSMVSTSIMWLIIIYICSR